MWESIVSCPRTLAYKDPGKAVKSRLLNLESSTLITISLSYMYHCLSHNYYFLIYCLLFRPPSGADPGQVHMKYDAVKLQDYEFKITK